MANFEETVEQEIEFDDVEDLGKEQQEPEAVEEPAVEEKPEVVIPDKYQGKSVEDIVKMHQEAEKLIGKQAQEVGEVRKLADELLKRDLNQKQAVEPPKEEVDLASRLYEDPASVINETVEKHPAIAEARKQALNLKQNQVLEKLKINFPDYEQTLTNSNFVEWVKASPIRIRLLSEANSNYDYDSAAEIFNNWNILNPKEQVADLNLAEESKKERNNNLKAATVDTGSPAPTSRKTYRRADLINLRLRDPQRYEAMQDEIMSAYAEGRVK